MDAGGSRGCTGPWTGGWESPQPRPWVGQAFFSLCTIPRALRTRGLPHAGPVLHPVPGQLHPLWRWPLKGRGISTHHEEEVPGLGHTELAREDSLHVPGHQAVEHRVQQQHAQHLPKAEVIVHIDGTQEVSPLDARAWRTDQENGPRVGELGEPRLQGPDGTLCRLPFPAS